MDTTTPATKEVRITDDERVVLGALLELDEDDAAPFQTIINIIAKPGYFDRRRVRRLCRSLRRKGLTKHVVALCDEFSGEFRGAGYALTSRGRAVARDSGLAEEVV